MTMRRRDGSVTLHSCSTRPRGTYVLMSADLIPILGTVIGAAGALAALMVALAAWLRADIRADIRALDGRVNVLAERIGDLGERVARLEARPD